MESRKSKVGAENSKALETDAAKCARLPNSLLKQTHIEDKETGKARC